MALDRVTGTLTVKGQAALRAWQSGLRVVGSAQAARWAGAWDDVDARLRLDQVLELGSVDQGDPVALGELFARA
jgi:hypothetical protein